MSNSINRKPDPDNTTIVSSVLPTGAATSANQTNGNQITKLKGNSDGTLIGNVADALKVTSSQTGLVNDGKLFSASAEINAASSGVNNPLLYIKNPTGSGKDLYFWRGRFGSSVTNTAMIYQIYVNPTVTANGSTLTPLNRNVSGSSPASDMQVYTIPTVSSNGTLASIAVVGQNTISIDINEEFAIRIAPGKSLLITGNPTSNNRSGTVTVVWEER